MLNEIFIEQIRFREANIFAKIIWIFVARGNQINRMRKVINGENIIV